jgi:hypothetical protein
VLPVEVVTEQWRVVVLNVDALDLVRAEQVAEAPLDGGSALVRIASDRPGGVLG